MPKIIQSGGFLVNKIWKLSKKALINLDVLLTNDVFPELITKANLPILDEFERKISGRGTVRTWKKLTIIILNDDMGDIIKTVKSLEDTGLLIDGATETAEHETKKQEGGALPVLIAPMAASLIAPMAISLIKPVASSLVEGTFGKGVSEIKEYGLLSLLAAPELLNVSFEKYLRGLEKVSWCLIIWIKILLHPLTNIEITKYFNYEARFNDVYSRNN